MPARAQIQKMAQMSHTAKNALKTLNTPRVVCSCALNKSFPNCSGSFPNNRLLIVRSIYHTMRSCQALASRRGSLSTGRWCWRTICWWCWTHGRGCRCYTMGRWCWAYWWCYMMHGWCWSVVIMTVRMPIVSLPVRSVIRTINYNRWYGVIINHGR